MKINLEEIVSDGSIFVTKIKVEGGYIYNSFDKSHNIMGSVFVPDLRTQIATAVLQGLSTINSFASAHDFTKEALNTADVLIDKLNKREIK
jgi:hypothetical protein